MSMNFNNSGPLPAPAPKKNNNSGIILAVVIGAIAVTTIIFGVISAQKTMEGFSSSSASADQTATVEIKSDTAWVWFSARLKY